MQMERGKCIRERQKDAETYRGSGTRGEKKLDLNPYSVMY